MIGVGALRSVSSMMRHGFDCIPKCAIRTYATSSSSDNSDTKDKHVSGRYATWETPIRFGPEPSPLEDGPDFCFADGRPTPLSNEKQFQKRKKELELAEQIVKLLGEVSEAELLYSNEQKQLQKQLLNNAKLKPRAKGV